MDGVVRAGVGLLAGVVLLGALVLTAIALAANEPPKPTISGEARVGETLTASNAILYKWQRCDPEASPCLESTGQNDAGWLNVSSSEGDPRTYTIPPPDLGFLIRVLAKDTSLGTQFAASEPVGPVGAAIGEPPPPPPPPPERTPPAFGQTGDLEPLSGKVVAKTPGSKRWEELGDLTQVPLGTAVDASDGRVELTTQKKPEGALQSIELWAGAFVVTQNPKRKITILRLAHSAARTTESGALAQAASHRKRKLWGRGKCRCRSKGRNSSGTARGTWWLTLERRKGTLTKVRKGKVLVKDFKRRKKVLVKKGQSYLARR